jgi:SanA protein
VFTARLRSFLRIALRIFIIGLVIAVGLVCLPRLATWIHSWGQIYSADQAPRKPVAIVFGAGLWRDGRPTAVLSDRVKTAADLYFTGKVDALLMSGTSVPNYNEPRAMRNYAIGLGVPNEAIVQDLAGLRTYDTCYRARHIYGVENALLVTQGFHLPRALYLCDALGVQSVGVASDLREYRTRSQVYWQIREILATMVALWELYVDPPLPALGEPQPIPPREAQ